MVDILLKKSHPLSGGEFEAALKHFNGIVAGSRDEFVEVDSYLRGKVIIYVKKQVLMVLASL